MIILPSKKIILFLVEGITDKTALGAVMGKIVRNDKIEFQITRGDLTSDPSCSISNILERVCFTVKEFSGKIFKAKDFAEVIHLVDTDGAFIPQELVLYDELAEDPVYELECIKTKNVDYIRNRNNKKTAIIKKLMSTKTVWKTIPYSVYYFSCNLDHVLYNELNLSSAEKNDKSNHFERSCSENPIEFLNLINADNIGTKGTYEETWAFIQNNKNSLNRFTNFNLLFNENAKNKKLI